MKDLEIVSDNRRLEIRFWGVRGSIPSPGPAFARYGGNTPCVEVSYGDSGVVIDAGSGIRKLGGDLSNRKKQFDKQVLFTHFHWDHIQGLPFFGPLYRSAPQLLLGSALPAAELRSILDGQMQAPYFPTTMELPPGIKCFETPLEGFQVGDLSIQPFPLHHPEPTWGFRIESPSGVYVHGCDFEHGSEGHDRILREFARGADLVTFDAHFAPEEYDSHRGWGHSTWAEGVKVAKDAGVKRLALFHHHPDREDADVDRLASAAQAEFRGAFAAREGVTLVVDNRRPKACLEPAPVYSEYEA